jgi:uncharacterized protein YqgQ
MNNNVIILYHSRLKIIEVTKYEVTKNLSKGILRKKHETSNKW